MIFGGKGKQEKATGSQKQEHLLCDLDAIVDEQHTFRIFGQNRRIKPITTEVFFGFANGVVEFKNGEFKTVDSLNQAFHSLMSKVTDDLSLADVERMEMVQKFVLVQHVSEIIMGQETKEEASKKKAMMAMGSLTHQ